MGYFLGERPKPICGELLLDEVEGTPGGRIASG
jgi:hypothetical protein